MPEITWHFFAGVDGDSCSCVCTRKTLCLALLLTPFGIFLTHVSWKANIDNIYLFFNSFKHFCIHTQILPQLSPSIVHLEVKLVDEIKWNSFAFIDKGFTLNNFIFYNFILPLTFVVSNIQNTDQQISQFPNNKSFSVLNVNLICSTQFFPWLIYIYLHI